MGCGLVKDGKGGFVVGLGFGSGFVQAGLRVDLGLVKGEFLGFWCMAGLVRVVVGLVQGRSGVGLAYVCAGWVCSSLQFVLRSKSVSPYWGRLRAGLQL